MKLFSYLAVDSRGESVAGELNAASELDLDRQLETRGLTLTKTVKGRSRGLQKGRLKTTDLVSTTAQLATVTGAGVPILSGIEGIADRQPDPRAQALLRQIVTRLQGGETLSEAMGNFPDSFPEVYRASVQAGEATGELERVLERLAAHLEWIRGMRATTVQAMIYPCILLFALLGLVTILLTFVLPKIVGLFPGGTDELPRPTRMLILTSDFMRSNALFLVFGAVVLFFVMRAVLRTPSGKLRFHGLLLRIPKLGKVVSQLATSKFASTAGILQSAGCNVFETLRIAGKASGNAAVEASIVSVADEVRQGRRVSDSMTKHKHLDPLLVQMISVGEASGRLDHTLERTAHYYDEEVPRAVKRFLTFLEPAMLIVAAVVVGFILLAALLPIFQIYENLG